MLMLQQWNVGDTYMDYYIDIMLRHYMMMCFIDRDLFEQSFQLTSCNPYGPFLSCIIYT